MAGKPCPTKFPPSKKGTKWVFNWGKKRSTTRAPNPFILYYMELWKQKRGTKIGCINCIKLAACNWKKMSEGQKDKYRKLMRSLQVGAKAPKPRGRKKAAKTPGTKKTPKETTKAGKTAKPPAKPAKKDKDPCSCN